MRNEPLKDLIYLSSSQILPLYLQKLRGVRWYRSQSASELKEVLKSQQGEIYVIVRSDYLSLRAVQAFLSWGHAKVKASFIFIAQSIENSVHQVVLNHPQILVLRESERERIEELITQRLSGKSVRSRKQERMAVLSQVMLKKSVMAENSPTGAWVQFLREGVMVDFSSGGAQITLGDEPVQRKDFISLMYKNQHGTWVSVESQVRWVTQSPEGKRVIGVQFLAVS
ncbi:PilZ domain-containing protein [Bdellovibrio bacteriovorus]|uniref:PilZ domain-containing protein n=1 Tax=Bdellovibrio bacteriovorus TaxID=959 RepID=UPI0021CEC6B3|nr:PilZ domain-containing protein [Bdellovibrio bacteriovorus]UXR63835.1 PilZ domain-containing protein [Bdellovibrio bacteriovorus]